MEKLPNHIRRIIRVIARIIILPLVIYNDFAVHDSIPSLRALKQWILKHSEREFWLIEKDKLNENDIVKYSK